MFRLFHKFWCWKKSFPFLHFCFVASRFSHQLWRQWVHWRRLGSSFVTSASKCGKLADKKKAAAQGNPEQTSKQKPKTKAKAIYNYIHVYNNHRISQHIKPSQVTMPYTRACKMMNTYYWQAQNNGIQVSVAAFTSFIECVSLMVAQWNEQCKQDNGVKSAYMLGSILYQTWDSLSKNFRSPGLFIFLWSTYSTHTRQKTWPLSQATRILDLTIEIHFTRQLGFQKAGILEIWRKCTIFHHL